MHFKRSKSSKSSKCINLALQDNKEMNIMATRNKLFLDPIYSDPSNVKNNFLLVLGVYSTLKMVKDQQILTLSIHKKCKTSPRNVYVILMRSNLLLFTRIEARKAKE